MKLSSLQKRHLNWSRKITHCYSRTAKQKLRQSTQISIRNWRRY